MPRSIPALYAAAVAAFLKRPGYFYAVIGVWVVALSLEAEVMRSFTGIAALGALAVSIMLNGATANAWALAAVSANDDAPLPLRRAYAVVWQRMPAQLMLGLNVALYAIIPGALVVALMYVMIFWSRLAGGDPAAPWRLGAFWVPVLFLIVLGLGFATVPLTMASFAVVRGERGWGAFRRWLGVTTSAGTRWAYVCVALSTAVLGTLSFGWGEFANWIAATVLRADGLAAFIGPLVQIPLGSTGGLVVAACWTAGGAGDRELDRSYRAPALITAVFLAVVTYVLLHPHYGPVWYRTSFPAHRGTTPYYSEAACERAISPGGFCSLATGMRFGWR